MNGAGKRARFRSFIVAAFFIACAASGAMAAMPSQPVVLELFTSQGCSSCPPADALLKRLATEDPSVLPLSFHVHYWDYLGWKDPYSSAENTERQKAYSALGGGQIFTPQLIVNGMVSVVGSDETRVRGAITAAHNAPPALDVSMIPDALSGNLTVTISDMGHSPVNDVFDVVEVHFDHDAKTHVEAGENSGRMLENINNVTAIKSLGAWSHGEKRYTIPANSLTSDGVVVFVQNREQGRILGAASYLKP